MKHLILNLVERLVLVDEGLEMLELLIGPLTWHLALAWHQVLAPVFFDQCLILTVIGVQAWLASILGVELIGLLLA